jgi:hypothetical protein
VRSGELAPLRVALVDHARDLVGEIAEVYAHTDQDLGRDAFTDRDHPEQGVIRRDD